MIEQKDIFCDMHTHTIFSKHGYSTLKENLDVAIQRNMDYIAITDHFFHNVYVDDMDKENELRRIKYMENQVNIKENRVIGSAEFNIGQLLNHDCKKIIDTLDWKPIGVHSDFLYLGKTKFQDLYDYFDNATKRFNCFVHIERELEKLEYGKYAKPRYGNQDSFSDNIKLWFEAICILAKKKNILLEVNETSLRLNESNNQEKIKYWLRFAKQNGNLICLGTDSHFCDRVGDFPLTLELLNQLDFPKDRILNCNRDLFSQYISR